VALQPPPAGHPQLPQPDRASGGAKGWFQFLLNRCWAARRGCLIAATFRLRVATDAFASTTPKRVTGRA